MPITCGCASMSRALRWLFYIHQFCIRCDRVESWSQVRRASLRPALLMRVTSYILHLQYIACVAAIRIHVHACMSRMVMMSPCMYVCLTCAHDTMSRSCLIAGALTYSTWVAANIYYNVIALYAASAVIGVGASLLWTAQGMMGWDVM